MNYSSGTVDTRNILQSHKSMMTCVAIVSGALVIISNSKQVTNMGVNSQLTDSFIGDHNSSISQQFFDIKKTQGDTKVKSHRLDDNLGRIPAASIRVLVLFHSRTLPKFGLFHNLTVPLQHSFMRLFIINGILVVASFLQSFN